MITFSGIISNIYQTHFMYLQYEGAQKVNIIVRKKKTMMLNGKFMQQIKRFAILIRRI